MELLRKNTTGTFPGSAQSIRVYVLFAATGERNAGDRGADAFADSLSLVLTP